MNDPRLGNLSFPGVRPSMIERQRSLPSCPSPARPFVEVMREMEEKEREAAALKRKAARQEWVKTHRAARIYLSSHDVRAAAEYLCVHPVKLLRSVSSFYRVHPNCGRQLIADLANQFGPGMSSRGDHAYNELSRRVAW